MKTFYSVCFGEKDSKLYHTIEFEHYFNAIGFVLYVCESDDLVLISFSDWSIEEENYNEYVEAYNQ